MGPIAMSNKELHRAHVLGCVLEGQLPLQDAARLMGVTYRQARRLKRKMEKQGPQGLAHGNRGRPPPNRIEPAVKRRILELAAGPYAGVNDTHFQELLAEREDVTIGRETLRGILRQAGHPPKRRRRVKKHHRRRERSPSKGLMVLWDGSPHRWFGPRQPSCTLMAIVDDADGELIHAFFCRAETTEAYLRLLQGMIRRRGLPVCIYMDRHSALRRNDKYWSLQEQLAGERKPTQVGMALEELGIEGIFARSPQAKGRIERLFGTLQDRLLAEMKLDGIADIEAANEYLSNRWIHRYNKRFVAKPTNKKSSFRSARGLELKRILSFRYEATVANDNTVSVGGITIQIPPGQHNRGYAKALVDVRQHLDGSWSVYYHDNRIARAKPTPVTEPLRYRRKSRKKQMARGAFEEVFVYSPETSTTPEDIFARQLTGPIASA